MYSIHLQGENVDVAVKAFQEEKDSPKKIMTEMQNR